MAKVYNALLLNRIEPEIEKTLRKKQNVFWGRAIHITNSDNPSNHRRNSCKKNSRRRSWFVNFSESFDSKHVQKMKQILLAYGIPKETVTVMIMFYRNTKAKFRSLDGDIHFLNIAAGVQQGNTLSPLLFIISLDYILRTSIDLMKEYCLYTKKKRVECRRYPGKTITDADYADNIALFANTPSKDEFLQHSLEHAAGAIGLHVHADKTEHICFNLGDIFTLNGGLLKLMDNFTYLVSTV